MIDNGETFENLDKHWINEVRRMRRIKMEIRKPKFELGQKAVDRYGNVITVIKLNSYHFEDDEYWYDVSYDGEKLIKKESFLEPYAEKPKTIWDLQKGDTYYVIGGNGEVMNAIWANIYIDKDCRKNGNVFLNEEEAENEVERRKIETEMLRLGGTRKINELNSNIVYTIQMHFGLKYVYVRSFDIKQAPIGVIFFNYRKQAIKALETIGESKVKKYIFGVDE